MIKEVKWNLIKCAGMCHMGSVGLGFFENTVIWLLAQNYMNFEPEPFSTRKFAVCKCM